MVIKGIFILKLNLRSMDGYLWMFSPSYPFYTPPESTVTEITHADPVAKRGTSFNVRGRVRDSHGRLLDGMQVLIYLKEEKDAPCLSYTKANVENGYFEVECDVKRTDRSG